MTLSTSARASVLIATFILAAVLVECADPHSYHEGNYGTAGLPHTDLSDSKTSWDYTSLNDWPKLCRTGSRQSPISFTNVDPGEVVMDAPLKRLQFSSKCFFPKDETQMRIVNEGAVNTVSFERQGRLPEDLSECTVVDPLNKSRIYYFSELHFHATSEHKFRNLRPDVEMHLSFITDEVKAKNREVLTVAVLLKASTSINSTSARALRHILVDGSLPRRHAMTTCFLTEDMSITSLLPTRESYLLYDGSETHPPCHENVRWVVMTSPILISRVAVGKLRDSMDLLLPNDFHRFGNVRPPQALNGRRIYRFDDTSVPHGGRRSEGTLEDAWAKRKKGGTAVLNETAVDDVFRVQAEEAEAPEDSDYVDIDADPYNDEEETTTTTTTTTEEPVHQESNEETDEKKSIDNETRKEDDATEATGTAASDASANVTMAATNVTAESTTSHANTTTSSSPAETEPSDSTTTTANSTTTTTTSTTTTSTSTTTSTTKKPVARKGKKGRGSASKNASETAADSGSSDDVVKKSLNATTTGAWSRFKNFCSHAASTVSRYARHSPGRTALIVLCNIALFFLICTCIRRWKSPVYVAGIDPRELQPLNPNPAFGQYGGTGGAASVSPVRPPAE